MWSCAELLLISHSPPLSLLQYPLRHLGSQLCELEKLIDKMMVEDFSMYTRSDLNRSLREEPHVLEKVTH